MLCSLALLLCQWFDGTIMTLVIVQEDSGVKNKNPSSIFPLNKQEGTCACKFSMRRVRYWFDASNKKWPRCMYACMRRVCYSTIRIGILVMHKHVIVSQIWSNFQRTVFSITKKSNLLCSLMGRAGEEIAKPSGNEEANYWSLSPTTTWLNPNQNS